MSPHMLTGYVSTYVIGYGYLMYLLGSRVSLTPIRWSVPNMCFVPHHHRAQTTPSSIGYTTSTVGYPSSWGLPLVSTLPTHQGVGGTHVRTSIT
jgi:hypothetical protein